MEKSEFIQLNLSLNLIYSYNLCRLENRIESGINYIDSDGYFIVKNRKLDTSDLNLLIQRNNGNIIFDEKTKNVFDEVNNIAKGKNMEFSAKLKVENSIINIIDKDKNLIDDYREKKSGRIVLSDCQGKIYTKDIAISQNVDKLYKELRQSVNELSFVAENRLKVENFKKNEVACIIFSPESAGYLVHEIFGHMLEIDSECINNYFYKHNYLGKKVCSENLNIIDTHISEMSIGLSNYDDEGSKLKEAILVENGVIKNFIVNRKLAKEINQEEIFGFARCESYRSKPIARMRNTYIKNNTAGMNLNEIIETTNSGYLINDIQFGRVDINTGNYQLFCGLIYFIKNGKKREAYYGAIITGNILSTMGNITEVGRDLKFGFGDCVKNAQPIMVGMGSPTIKVKSLNINGGYYGL
ncbi:TldD/PmbA family protein [Clostridium saccharobutylicum]|uniref:Metalloprotease TldD n=1 Tax=Clostridium saccharobutylicum TaxID=169679 RepID=A0A1S8N625_CLOSA|nr:TldD/PmbA family protein [Clostridium saccharobutylicum]OOM11966.1 metalloprotease TldD [Clostridium saccharobutylicum]